MMNDISPRVLVIIVNYRTPQMSLRAATAALADLPQGAELVIVDNGSQDGSADILQGEISARGWDAEGRVQ
jgi:N-acetylglucosaminyl-diphospho-decaprenol L-rhamnosyltransferase